MKVNLLLSSLAVASFAVAVPAFAQVNAQKPNYAAQSPSSIGVQPMTKSSAGVTVFQGGEVPATVGDDALTFTESGTGGGHGITSHGRNYMQGNDTGPGNDTGN